MEPGELQTHSTAIPHIYYSTPLSHAIDMLVVIQHTGYHKMNSKMVDNTYH